MDQLIANFVGQPRAAVPTKTRSLDNRGRLREQERQHRRDDRGSKIHGIVSQDSPAF